MCSTVVAMSLALPTPTEAVKPTICTHILIAMIASLSQTNKQTENPTKDAVTNCQVVTVFKNKETKQAAELNMSTRTRS